jgi:hypothetical protein
MRWLREDLPFGWMALVIFLGVFGGGELARAVGAEPRAWQLGDTLLYVGTILACSIAALCVVRLLRRHLPEDHGGTAE